jgi:hypothetical protein
LVGDGLGNRGCDPGGLVLGEGEGKVVCGDSADMSEELSFFWVAKTKTSVMVANAANQHQT